MHLKKPSFRRTDFSPSWTHKSDSLPNFGVNNEKREIGGQNDDLGFEHDKPSTSEDQGANVSSDGCSTSGAHTDATVTTPEDQQDKKGKSGDPMGKPVQPVSKTGLTGFHRMSATRSSKCSRRRSIKT
jgi:hypothetical protein